MLTHDKLQAYKLVSCTIAYGPPARMHVFEHPLDARTELVLHTEGNRRHYTASCGIQWTTTNIDGKRITLALKYAMRFITVLTPRWTIAVECDNIELDTIFVTDHPDPEQVTPYLCPAEPFTTASHLLQLRINDAHQNIRIVAITVNQIEPNGAKKCRTYDQEQPPPGGWW